jgi:hypothetical protein
MVSNTVSFTLWNLNVTLESSIALGKISGGTESVSQMVTRYDQAINYWDESWGSRNQVIVAINGYFFDPETGIPWRGQIHSSWYSKQFDDLESGSGFVWKLDRSAFIGGCVAHKPAKQIITFLTTGETQPFNGINVVRGDDDLIVYTPQYDKKTQTEDEGLEVLVELKKPLMIFPSPGMIDGKVVDIRDGNGSSPIQFDHVVLSASGERRTELLGKIKVGDEIGFSQEVKHWESNCQTPSNYSWDKTYASIGGSFVFLQNGVIQKDEDLGAILRNGRTAIVYNDRYIFFVVVGNREPVGNLGMSIVELAVFAKNTLGATWGIAQDGGGSSTMVVNGELKNMPDDLERPVSNGFMMVVVEPEERSYAFNPGDQVTTKSSGELDVYLGPGSNYGILTSVPANTAGVVFEHRNQLNGILAKGSFWWKVTFGSISGWVVEQDIIPFSAP